MTGDQAHSKPDGYWDRAGEQGYGQAMYRSSDVESHVRGRVWQTAIDIAGALGVPEDGHVLDLGCGDGAFANQTLAGRYRKVDGIDKSVTQLIDVAGKVAHNTAYIPQLQATAPVLGQIVDEAIVQDGYMNALTDGYGDAAA